MRQHRTPEQWQHLVTQQQDSGLSAPQFCKQHDIAYASFSHWRKRLSTELESENSAAPQVPGFLDLSSLMAVAEQGRASWNIVLSLGNGVELRLSQNE